MKRVGTIFICIGVIIAVSPLAGELYMNHKREELYNQYVKNSSTEGIELENYNNNVSSSLDKEDKLEKKMNRSKLLEVETKVKLDYSAIKLGEVIGKVIIPSIEVELLIIEGESDKNLGLGAGHMMHTAYPGEKGNCVLAGHRNYTFGSMFNRLGEVVLGAEIHVETKNIIFTYVVDEIEIIEPTKLDILNQPENEKRITLLTCHPINIGNKRLLVKGHLLE